MTTDPLTANGPRAIYRTPERCPCWTPAKLHRHGADGAPSAQVGEVCTACGRAEVLEAVESDPGPSAPARPLLALQFRLDRRVPAPQRVDQAA